MSIQMTVAFTPKYIQQIVYFEYTTTIVLWSPTRFTTNNYPYINKQFLTRCKLNSFINF